MKRTISISKKPWIDVFPLSGNVARGSYIRLYGCSSTGDPLTFSIHTGDFLTTVDSYGNVHIGNNENNEYVIVRCALPSDPTVYKDVILKNLDFKPGNYYYVGINPSNDLYAVEYNPINDSTYVHTEAASALIRVTTIPAAVTTLFNLNVGPKGAAAVAITDNGVYLYSQELGNSPVKLSNKVLIDVCVPTTDVNSTKFPIFAATDTNDGYCRTYKITFDSVNNAYNLSESAALSFNATKFGTIIDDEKIVLYRENINNIYIYDHSSGAWTNELLEDIINSYPNLEFMDNNGIISPAPNSSDFVLVSVNNGNFVIANINDLTKPFFWNLSSDIASSYSSLLPSTLNSFNYEHGGFDFKGRLVHENYYADGYANNFDTVSAELGQNLFKKGTSVVVHIPQDGPFIEYLYNNIGSEITACSAFPNLVEAADGFVYSITSDIVTQIQKPADVQLVALANFKWLEILTKAVSLFFIGPNDDRTQGSVIVKTDAPDLNYSLNRGKTWSIASNGDTITSNGIAPILFRCEGGLFEWPHDPVNSWTFSDRVYIGGELNSLFYNNTTRTVGSLFRQSDEILSIPRIKAVGVARESMFAYMCNSSKNIKSVYLDITCGGVYTFLGMFMGSISLENVFISGTPVTYDNSQFMSMLDSTKIKCVWDMPGNTVECYRDFATECTNLVVVPRKLTGSAGAVYLNAFGFPYNPGTGSLSMPVELMATTLDAGCFDNMFMGNTTFNNLTVHFDSWTSNSTNNWLDGVSATGTFTCPAALPDIRDGSHIPVGWTRVDI